MGIVQQKTFGFGNWLKSRLADREDSEHEQALIRLAIEKKLKIMLH